MSSAEYFRWTPAPPTTLADIEGLRRDIWDARDFFGRLKDSAGSADYLTLDALASAAVIRYCRAFGSGSRTLRLNIDNLPDVSAEERATHEYIRDVRDKHVAHAVNAMETNDIYVCVALDSDGNPMVTAVSSGTATGIPLVAEVYERAHTLCGRWLGYLHETSLEESARLLPIARQLSREELSVLPRGPIEPSEDPKKRRPFNRT